MPHPQDILPLPLPPSPASPHLLQGFHPSVQLFLNQWVTQGLRHPAPISHRPQPHISLPLVDLPTQIHLLPMTLPHPITMVWVGLLGLLQLGVLQTPTTTTGQAVLLLEVDTTIIVLPALQVDTITIGLPVARPGKILCLGLNYMDHVAEGPFDKQPFPAIFMRSATSLVAANQPIIAPAVSETLDYEAELAVIIGKKCKNLTEDNALDAIAGYSCFNDGSVREFQRHTIQWTMGKNFDKTGPFGPIMVTPDELPKAATGLKIECRLNGQTVQSSTTDMMIFPVIETLIYIVFWSKNVISGFWV